MEWRDDDWLYLKSGGYPRLEVPAPVEAINTQAKQVSENYDFSNTKIPLAFQSLRIPMSEEWISLQARPSFLRLYGRESLTSFHRQSLLARRIQHFNMQATTCLDFSPRHYQQMAGLVCYYNTSHWYYLHLHGGEINENSGKKYLQITSCDNFEMQEQLQIPMDLTDNDQVHLKAHLDHAALQFAYSLDGQNWTAIGPILDGSILSDDYVRDGSNRYRPAFTGAFVGVCCQDLSGLGQFADFGSFRYAGE
ncbi:MAG: hypothetical protein AAF242_15955 [Bacteroidota bacterium]